MWRARRKDAQKTVLDAAPLYESACLSNSIFEVLPSCFLRCGVAACCNA
jgi:hypothetical protein